jgi:predicted Fe-Mo cluster-binding NifX family protein
LCTPKGLSRFVEDRVKERIVKVAISSYGKSLKAKAYERFGRCKYFVIVDTATDKTSALKNSSAKDLNGAGTACARKLFNAGVGAVVTGKVGSNACKVLKDSGVGIYFVPSGLSAQEAFDQFKSGSLPEASADIEKDVHYENCYFSVR